MTFPLVNTFAGSPLDRSGERRGDAAWLGAALDAQASRAIALWNGDPLVRGEGEPRLVRLPAPLAAELAGGPERLLFLGLGEGSAAVFAVDFEGAADPSEGPLAGHGAFVSLRDAAARLEPGEAAMAASARAVFEWRRRHRFCAACGAATTVAEGGWKRICPACETQHFPRTDPVVIMLPAAGDRCLLGRQASWRAGRFSTIAGFVEPGESLEEAAARELMEETGLTLLAARYHSSQPWPFPASLMVGMIAEVADGEARPDQTELEAVRWFTREEARALIEGGLDGLSGPPPTAIAHQLLKSWIEQR